VILVIETSASNLSRMFILSIILKVTCFSFT
jgi:hypothetical protein